MKTTPDRQGAVMSDETSRGQAIKRRRLALGIDSIAQFAEATGRDRETLSRVERDEASETTVEWVEHWLERMEASGPPAEEEHHAVRVTLHGVYGIDEVIFDGPTSPDEMAAYLRALMAELKPSTGKDASVDKPGE